MNPRTFEQLTIQQISNMIDNHIVKQKQFKQKLMRHIKKQPDQPPSKKSELVELFE
jgi:hypothetical protein